MTPSAPKTWVTPEPIECVMMTVPPGRVAAVRFAVEGVSAGLPVITMEHVNRLTDAAAPHWPYPPDGRPGVHRATVARWLEAARTALDARTREFLRSDLDLTRIISLPRGKYSHQQLCAARSHQTSNAQNLAGAY